MAGWLQFSSPRQGKDSWTEVSRYTESVTSSVSDAELRTAASESGSSVSGAPFEARVPDNESPLATAARALPMAWHLLRKKVLPEWVIQASFLQKGCWNMSSSCTGAYTAEMAAGTVAKVVNERDAACRQLVIDHHKWMEQSGIPTSRRLPCIFGDILDQLPASVDREAGDFAAKRRRVRAAGLLETQHCWVHNDACRLDVPVQIDVSGLPCPDNSRANLKRKFQEGGSGIVYATWAQRHIQKRTPLLLIENVPDINVAALRDLLEEDYILTQLRICPSDAGHTGVARPRTYVFCSHRKTCRYLFCLHKAYSIIQATLEKHICTSPADYLVASPAQLRVACEKAARQRRVDVCFETWSAVIQGIHVSCAAACGMRRHESSEDQTDWSSMLSQAERDQVASYTAKYEARFRRRAADDPDLVFFLGDTARWCTWSACSRKIPTFRRGSGKFWYPASRRWLVASEKLAALGFPGTAASAAVLGLHVLPVTDPLRADSVYGNSMHFSNCQLMMLLAVTCFGPVAREPTVDWNRLA
ncbi:unnamed protein product [Symbiodinium natans]|uniref:Uncharacterized protein n=1 Tax=Symbiodinium natans TaxID=878477 RepID=A0A812I8B8_9DINO|nr:unnamed protein product [Symbiodinium natans]